MPVILNPYKAGRFGTIHSPRKGLSDDKLYLVVNSESNGIENASSAEIPRQDQTVNTASNPTLDVRLRYTFLQAG